MSTLGSASHIEKLDEINRLRAINAELLAELKNMTLLFRAALLCTSVEIARAARPHIAAAEAAIAKATPHQSPKGNPNPV